MGKEQASGRPGHSCRVVVACPAKAKGKVTLTFTTPGPARGPAVRWASAAGRLPGGRHVVRIMGGGTGGTMTPTHAPTRPRGHVALTSHQHRRALATAEYPSDGSDRRDGARVWTQESGGRHRARSVGVTSRVLLLLVCLRPLPAGSARPLSDSELASTWDPLVSDGGRWCTRCLCRGDDGPHADAGSQLSTRRYGFVVSHEFCQGRR